MTEPYIITFIDYHAYASNTVSSMRTTVARLLRQPSVGGLSIRLSYPANQHAAIAIEPINCDSPDLTNDGLESAAIRGSWQGERVVYANKLYS